MQSSGSRPGCYTQPVADDFIKRIRSNKKRLNETMAELPVLVYGAMKAGHHWRELADELAVGKARIYQLRAEGEAAENR